MNTNHSSPFQEMCKPIQEEIVNDMLAKAIGDLLLRHMDELKAAVLAQLVSSRQTQLLAQIKAILDLPNAEDNACFYTIEAMVDAFSSQGIYTSRHDFG